MSPPRKWISLIGSVVQQVLYRGRWSKILFFGPLSQSDLIHLRIYFVILTVNGTLQSKLCAFLFLRLNTRKAFLIDFYHFVSHFPGRITKNCLCLSPCLYRPQFERCEGYVQTVPWNKGDGKLTGVTKRELPQGSAGTTWWASAHRMTGAKGTKAPRRGAA